MRRFLNADAYASTGQGIIGNNMFAYCLNNPVCLIDSLGTRPIAYGENGKEAEDTYMWSIAYMNEKRVIDITKKLNEAMRKNTEELREYYRTHSFINSVAFFVEKVKPNGEWDFKSQESWNLDSNTRYLYDGIVLRYDDIGNIHYGYVGRVLFQTDTLLKAGGLVQISTRTSDWSYRKTNFDDPRDQWAIQYGCILWENGVLFR